MEEKPRPRLVGGQAKVGVGIMLLKDGKVLLGKRHDDAGKASSDLHGEGTWTMPGGKLDFHETLIDGALRELAEEIGVKLPKESLDVLCVQDDMVPDNHYVTIGFVCRNFEAEPKVMEPEEITEWRWFDFNALPEKVYAPSAKMIKAYLAGKLYNL